MNIYNLFLSLLLLSSTTLIASDQTNKTSEIPWTFVSIPDFLNFDIEYPQQGWEDSLGFIVKSMKSENPAFAVVAGDLVMGHWGTTEKEINQWADRYYPQWFKRFQDHDLKLYTTIGDHEVGDNPWHGARGEAVPYYKAAFRKHAKMPLNGADHMKGSAFYWIHNNVLFISVDVFEKANGKQGKYTAQVTGKQLEWFEQTITEQKKNVDHIIVVGHTPVIGPVRTYSSSGMMLDKGQQSVFWQSMKKHNIDLYICGEVHAVTCLENDGIQQVAHGGLIGRTTKPNYMSITVHPNKLVLNIKEIDLVNGTGRLWQEKKAKGSWDTITITPERKTRGFTSIGSITIDKSSDNKSFLDAKGFFLSKEVIKN